MSASVLAPSQGLSQFVLGTGINFPATIAVADRVQSLSGNWVQTDFLGGAGGVSYSGGALVFAKPGTFEIISQIQGQSPADLENSDGKGGLLHFFNAAGSASTQAKAFVYLPCAATAGTPPLSTAAEVIFTASGVVSIPVAGGSISPVISFPGTGDNTGTGSCLAVAATASQILVRRLA